MKKITLILALVLVSLTLSAQSRSEQRKIKRMERTAAIALMVDSLVNAQQFTFMAERAVTSLPSNPYITLSGVNDMVIKDGTITSRLPFYGTLYSAPLSPTDSPLSFTSDHFSISVLTNKAGKNLLKIVLDKSSTPVPNNSITMVVEIFEDATAVLNITMVNGSSSMFYGYIGPNK